jgi:hypothetical protein
MIIERWRRWMIMGVVRYERDIQTEGLEFICQSLLWTSYMLKYNLSRFKGF